MRQRDGSTLQVDPAPAMTGPGNGKIRIVNVSIACAPISSGRALLVS